MKRPVKRAVSPFVAAGTALSLGSLALVLDNLRRLRVPDPHPPPLAEEVAVLVPARDEAEHIGGCLRAVLAAADARVRVLVLDDCSSDRTRAVAKTVAADDPRVRVLEGRPTPPGWVGKSWACHQLAEEVGDTTDVLVFVDADVRLEPHALAASVQLLRRHGLDLVCPYPRQLAASPAERLVQPLLQWSWMSSLPLGVAERSDRPSLAVANGQLLVADRAIYHRAGGHRGVRGEVLEDLELLRAVRSTGGRGTVADGTGVASCRMYSGWAELRAGYRKSLWRAFGSDAGAAAVVALLTLAYVVPALAALRGSRLGLLGYAASVAGRALVARRTGGRVAPDALAHPLSILALAVLVADSVVGRHRGTVRWRGRALPTGGVP